jgi:hypothetical protein
LFDNTQSSTLIAELEKGVLIFSESNRADWVSTLFLDISKADVPDKLGIRQLENRDAVREFYLRQKKEK